MLKRCLDLTKRHHRVALEQKRAFFNSTVTLIENLNLNAAPFKKNHVCTILIEHIETLMALSTSSATANRTHRPNAQL